MAHENKNTGKTYKAVSAVSKSLNKKGKIRGKNKKETKYLKRACAHHYYTGKGKLKPAFYNNSNGMCVCEICERSFQTKIDSKEVVREATEQVLNYANQLSVAITSGDLGNNSLEEVIALKVALEKFPKLYTRVFKAVSKEDNIKKKKKNNNNGGGSSQYGGWSRK